MNEQNKTKTSEAVKTAVFNAFSNEFQSEAIDTLSRYGVEKYERDSEREQLAIVNLCGGDMDKLGELVAQAKKDYRNIIFNHPSTNYHTPGITVLQNLH
ncbi:MAG: hypothetical protein SWH54_04685 [Thermodesulfobacteriota bacterium]|nr:hypothetical protein [Thermodesulfobacteriota bacterium]